MAKLLFIVKSSTSDKLPKLNQVGLPELWRSIQHHIHALSLEQFPLHSVQTSQHTNLDQYPRYNHGHQTNSLWHSPPPKLLQGFMSSPHDAFECCCSPRAINHQRSAIEPHGAKGDVHTSNATSTRKCAPRHQLPPLVGDTYAPY